MKGKVSVAIAALALLALASLGCGGSGTAAAGASCPEGWEAVALPGVYHGVNLEVASSEVEYADGSGFSLSFEGQLHAYTADMDFWLPAGNPGAIYSDEGRISLRWDGHHACAKFHEE